MTENEKTLLDAIESLVRAVDYTFENGGVRDMISAAALKSQNDAAKIAIAKVKP